MIKQVDTIPLASIQIEARARQKYLNIKELADKIRQLNLIQPLAVKDLGDGNYRLLAGGRRFMAVTALEWTEVPVRIFPQDLSPIDQKEIELSENLDRMDYLPHEIYKLTQEIHNLRIEQAGGVKTSTAKDAPGHSLRDTAKELNVSRTQVQDHVSMASLMDSNPAIKDAIQKCKTHKEARAFVNSLSKKIISAKVAEEVRSGDLDETHKALIGGYYLCDVVEGMQKVQAETQDLAEIDPPYATDLKHSKKQTGAKSLDLEAYNELTLDEYEDLMFKVFYETFRVLKPDSFCLCWFAIQHYAITKHLLEEVGFTVWRVPAIWVKGSGQTNNPDKTLGSGYEVFFYARKGSPSINLQGHSNIFAFSPVTPNQKIHPTERPIPMMMDILKTFCEPRRNKNLVIPFLGSGNTILAGANLGFQGIGWDLSKEYQDSYIQRVVQNKPPEYGS